MITIHVTLYRNGFHGLRDTGEPDWPPSPRRILGALLAGAHAVADDSTRDRALDALQRLAAAPSPIIDAPTAIPLGLPGTYAPKTWLPDDKSPKVIDNFLDLSLIGLNTKSRVLKPQDGVALAGGTIMFHIDLDCGDAELAALEAAARHVPYFGTSKDPADLSVTDADNLDAPPKPPLERWYPDARIPGPAHGWQSNTVKWFEDNFQRAFGRDPAIAGLPPIPPAGFVRPLSYGRDIPPIRAAFSTAQLARSVPNHRIPPLILHLNTAIAEAVPDWRAFPLTVSHERDKPSANGDGRCVGFGLLRLDGSDFSVEEQARAGELLARYVAQLPEQPDGLVVGRSGALNPTTWTGPAKTWYSTTPLRAFPDKRVVHYELAKQLNERYGVELRDLALQHTPRIRRNGYWSNGDLADGLAQWWAELTVSEQIEGPLLLGAATDRGFGMFRPRS